MLFALPFRGSAWRLVPFPNNRSHQWTPAVCVAHDPQQLMTARRLLEALA
ncbi:MAG TPA: hypothetical protein VGZ73_23705 [Bryobacteraceae bacterium]|jgi:hypothetical protein|nr:hypothetical protein [Bryobacteraceae bacterium]